VPPISTFIQSGMKQQTKDGRKESP